MALSATNRQEAKGKDSSLALRKLRVRGREREVDRNRNCQHSAGIVIES